MECEFSSFEYEDASVTNLAPVALVHLRIRSRTSVRAVVCSVAELVCVGIDRQLEFDPGSTFADAAVAVLHSIVVASGVVLLDAELAELCELPYSYWRAAADATHEETLDGPRAARPGVSSQGDGHRRAGATGSVPCVGDIAGRLGLSRVPGRFRDRPRRLDRAAEGSRGDGPQRAGVGEGSASTRACHEDGPGNLAAPAGRPRGHSRISASADAMCFPHSTHRPDTSACG